MKRWTRYGHDRLYVQTQTGERLGYWDCKTGTAVVQPGADRDAFDTALVGHLPTRRAGGLGPSAERLYSHPVRASRVTALMPVNEALSVQASRRSLAQIH